MQFVGQELNLKIIDKWSKLPNFIIIQGDEHTGKTYLTKYICEKFKIQYVLMPNSIKDVRSLIKEMRSGGNVLYHFKDFDKASMQAKNALLKITEETPKGNTIVITGSKQLATLESRARKLVMSAYSENEVQPFIEKYFDKGKVHQYYQTGINTPAKVELYKDSDAIDDLIKYVDEIFNRLTTLYIDYVITISHKFEAKYDGIDNAILFLTLLINLISYKIRYECNYRFDFLEELKILIEGKTMLVKDKTLNRRFMLYRIFYSIMTLGGKN